MGSKQTPAEANPIEVRGGRRTRRRPTFLWQALLILLPVVVMASIALVAIGKDRKAAEREAERRAKEMVQQVGTDFGRRMGHQLNTVATALRLWAEERVDDGAVWPAESRKREGALEREQLGQNAIVQKHITGLARMAGVPIEDLVIQPVSFVQNKLREPPDFTRIPRPPEWRLRLSDAQVAAWSSFQVALERRESPDRLASALERLNETHPPEQLETSAEFLRLRDALARGPDAAAITGWLAFAEHCRDKAGRDGVVADEPWNPEVSESGLPFSSLGLLKALQRASVLDATLWSSLVWEVQMCPGALTPVLLDAAEPLTRDRLELQPAYRALRARWAATERAWEVADALRASLRLQPATTTNLWLESEGARWFCVLQPRETQVYSGQSGRPTTTTNWLTEAQLYHKALVQYAFSSLNEPIQSSLPTYLELCLVLEGEVIRPGAANSGRNDSTLSPQSAPLATLEGELSCPSVLLTPVNPRGSGTEFDAMPAHPHFELRVAVSDPARLFAAQRRRVWLFAGLILAAALAAAVGLLAAWRSFQRQLSLSEMKSNFVSSVSHELRAPIASLRLMAESLERGKIADPAKQQEYFRFISQECRRLSALIENVLDFSRIDQGRKHYEFEPLEVQAVLGRAVQLMEPYAAERQVKLRLVPPSAVGREQPVADGRALLQALINLLDNAIKHSPNGAEVLAGAEWQATTYALWVQDSGEGIPETEHEKIFERFYRRGSELRRETQGIGIGLTLVKHIIEAHGGKVLVRSASGQGSRFTLTLPITPPHAADS